MLHWGGKSNFQPVQEAAKGDGVTMLQQLRKSITALALLFGSASVFAQASQGPLTLKPDAPERYIVVPGDTLWGISGRYTDSPWRWPELWGMNRDQIRNPHLIYPGDVLVLDRATGRLSVSAQAGAAQAKAGGVKAPAGTAVLSPRVRSESLAREGIPSIPPGAIEPFLSRPLVVEPDGLEKAPTIVAAESDRVMLSAGNSAYVRGIGRSGEQSWYVYRKGGPLVDPDTGKTLAYEAVYLGTAHLARPGNPATVVLTSAVQEVETGDKLVAAVPSDTPNYVPHAPATEINGKIISIYGGIAQVGEAGRNSIVTLNRGRSDGLEIGHVLALYSAGGTVTDVAAKGGDSQIQLPDERSGLVFVFRVFDRVSYALVMNATKPVRPLDVVRTP